MNESLKGPLSMYSLTVIVPAYNESKTIENSLEKLLALEKRFGRDRQESLRRWQPRTLDLDLLAWGGLHVQREALTLPHPRLIERSFVVVPLAAALSAGGEMTRRIPPDLDWPE